MRPLSFTAARRWPLIKYAGATWDPGDDGAADSSWRWWTRLRTSWNRTAVVGPFRTFPDGELQDWAAAYFGDNLAWLHRRQGKYDPD